LDEDNVRKLYSEAQSQGISLNSLLNHIIYSFLEWHIFECKIGMVPIAKPVARELFTKMSKEQIIDIAKCLGKNEVQNAAIFMKGRKMDLDSFLSYFKNRMNFSSVQLIHEFDEKSGIHTLYYKT
jgi:hypothetical protein